MANGSSQHSDRETSPFENDPGAPPLWGQAFSLPPGFRPALLGHGGILIVQVKLVLRVSDTGFPMETQEYSKSQHAGRKPGGRLKSLTPQRRRAGGTVRESRAYRTRRRTIETIKYFA
jgi:hypothetical protein